jgi:tetratricopeptide (TPR) repeat protein
MLGSSSSTSILQFSADRLLALFRELGYLLGQAYALNDLGIVQQETADCAAAAASHQQALTLFGDLGNRLGQAEALNRLGELATRTANTAQAREHHPQALTIARGIRAAPEEARALEGLGQAHLHDGSPGQAAAQLRQALTIYQRIGAPAARRVQETIQNHNLTSTNPEPQPAAPDNEGHQPHTPAEPQEAARQAAVRRRAPSGSGTE